MVERDAVNVDVAGSSPASPASMVERVAKAMQQRAKEPLGNIESLEPVLVGSLGDAWQEMARAAISVMREPTPKMCGRACNALKRHVDGFTEEERAARWPGRKDDGGWRVPNKEKHSVRYTAMIDEALK